MELIHTVYIERGIRIVSTKVKTLEMVIKNKKLELVLLHTQTAGVLVLINNIGNKYRKKVYVS